MLTATGVMRHAVVRALHHARQRQAFGSALAHKPLMQNVLADLALESEAATVLSVRLAAAVDAAQTDLLRVAVPVAKYWVGKRLVPVVAEALECLGGNGFVEEHGLARAYRDAPGATLWEGAGNVTALDVLRAMTLQPRSMEVLLGEVDRARGADPRLDRAMDEVAGFLQAASREARRDPGAVEGGARWMVERLAVVLAGLAPRASCAGRRGRGLPGDPGERGRRRAARHAAGRAAHHAGGDRAGAAGLRARGSDRRQVAPAPAPAVPGAAWGVPWGRCDLRDPVSA